ncbi:MAG: DUF2974 domain-containing protein [Atopobiaceae bacterium]|nr:DUF2974 domain-containing protein [Atopobiaceae bacterium]
MANEGSAKEQQGERGIIQYLARQRASFTEKPLNDVDAAVLAFATYFYFEKGCMGNASPEQRVQLPVALCGIPRANLFGPGLLMRQDGDAFLAALLESSRFMELEVGHYVADLSSKREKQFCAVTFYLPDGTAFLAYRGSDNSLAGWKENLNLSFMEAVPSQLSARDYLEEVARDHDGPLMVGGHSKGGNLAEYAALTCDEEVYKRVVKIYNLDGPGFAHVPSDRFTAKGYKARLCKLVPESSVFGMVMEERPASNYRIVESEGYLITQHSPMRWVVVDDDFVRVDKISPDAAIIAKTINSWCLTYQPEQRELFVNAVFDIFGASNAQYWNESYDLQSWIKMFAAAAQLPAEIRNTVLSMLKDVAGVFGEETIKRAREVVGNQ